MKTQDHFHFLRNYPDYDSGPYILMAVARKAHNPDITNSAEPIYREVAYSPDDAVQKYRDIHARCELRPYEWRVYITANARDTLSAYWNFRNRMNGWSKRLMQGDEAAKEKMENVAGEWVSELHRPQNAADSYFTFDLDGINREGVETFVDALPRGYEYVRQSPNGYHVVAEPFEYPDWEPPVEYDGMDTDGQVHVSQILSSRG